MSEIKNADRELIKRMEENPKVGVMNACCGHGIEKDAYIHFWNGEIINGKEAIDHFSNEND